MSHDDSSWRQHYNPEPQLMHATDTVDDSVHALSWPADRLNEAVEALARRAGYPVTVTGGDSEQGAVAFATRMAYAAARLGLETEPVTTPYPERLKLLRHAGPAVLLLPGSGAPRLLLLLRGGLRKLVVLGPDLKPHRLSAEEVAACLTRDLEAPLRVPLEQLLEQAGVPGERRQRAYRVLLDQRLGRVQLEGCWLLRLTPAASPWTQLRHARVPRLLFGFGLTHIVRQGLHILGWWLIAQGALSGRIDTVWLLAWALVLLTAVPFELLGIWTQSRLTIGVGQLLKQRLLFGTLQLRSEEVRHQGIGQFLGRVLEAEALETLMLGGGFAALVAIIELAAAMTILGLGAGGALHSLLLLIWFIGALLLSWRYYDRSQHWRSSHRLMINALIERMVGHRTRLAQQDPAEWHRAEDRSLAAYLQLSRDTDRSAVRITGLLTRGWLLLGLLGLAYPLLFGQPDIAAIAISLGGILLASQAFTSMTIGVESLVGVLNAWRQVGPLFRAAERGRDEPVAEVDLPVATAEDGVHPLLVARDLVFRYRDYGQPVLQGCDLRIGRGDRLLLEGSSGGGKSTLAALLTGLRIPTSGLLLLRGLDRQTLGSASWRRRVVAAPQFHENHVLTETLAFNLLMGRRWPPSEEDLKEAETLCRELGLGPLLERMPAGLQQMVGESGWQLSHGERSRLYIARALLQGAELVVLDESFAALDPENLERALRCVLQRAPTLLVIAHP